MEMSAIAGRAAEIRASAGTELLFNKDEWASQQPNKPMSVSETDGCRCGKEIDENGTQHVM